MRDHALHQGDTWEDSPCAVIVDLIIWADVRNLGVTIAQDQNTSQAFVGFNQVSKREYYALE